MRPDLHPARNGDEFRILDAKGCLTPEVLCFSEQLNADQRAAVERHTRSCSICAQQQTALARASERFRRVRPRPALPAELRMMARQTALRTVIAKRQQASITAQLPARWAAREPFYHSRLFWTALLAGLGAALLVVLFVLLVF